MPLDAKRKSRISHLVLDIKQLYTLPTAVAAAMRIDCGIGFKYWTDQSTGDEDNILDSSDEECGEDIAPTPGTLNVGRAAP